MSDAPEVQLRACLAALRQLAAEAGEPDAAGEDWSTHHLNGWVDMVGRLVEQELDHLKINDDEALGAAVGAQARVAIAYLEALIDTPRASGRT
jgi:hypothetical protein